MHRPPRDAVLDLVKSLTALFVKTADGTCKLEDVEELGSNIEAVLGPTGDAHLSAFIEAYNWLMRRVAASAISKEISRESERQLRDELPKQWTLVEEVLSPRAVCRNLLHKAGTCLFLRQAAPSLYARAGRLSLE